MDKYEIFEKNLQDGDERERFLHYRGGLIGMIAMFVMTIILFILNQIFQQPSSDLQVISFTGLSVFIIYQYIITRQKMLLFFAPFAAIGTIGSMISYISLLLGA